jgi:DNA-binding NtrC family response regulator
MTAPSPPDPLILPARLALLEPISRFHSTNPFEPAWEDLQKAALRDHYDPAGAAPPSRGGALSENLERLTERLAPVLAVTAHNLSNGMVGNPEELALYQAAAVYGLWEQYGPELQRLIDGDDVEVPFYDAFVDSHRFLFGHPGLTVPEPGHLLALFYQARRAWYFPATKILGRSPSASAARAAIWRANMASDACAYADGLYRRMDEIPVLITGETGTGKELAAECVGWSRYIPFDAGARRFVRRYAEDFHVRNLCEVPGELLESALFGHKRGSFTGATVDTPGCFALPKAYGSLFLDEAGEIPEHVQVKLLRPFQNREYVPLGETRPRKLLGRLIFATHRDLEERCREGKFRPDLYERMNGVHVHMPSLRRMLAEAPEEMEHYVRAFVSGKLDGPDHVRRWTERVVSSIRATRFDSPWSRNLRELKNYTERYLLTDGRMSTPEVGVPASPPAAASRPEATSPRPAGDPGAPESTCLPSSGILGPRAKAGEVSFDELNRAYVTRVHVLTDQNKAETARRVGLDWRTVGRWIDPVRLARWLKGPT